MFTTLAMKKLFILSILFISCLSFRFFIEPSEEPVFVTPSIQRTGGDSAKGYDYLLNGDYIKSGVPEIVFRKAVEKPTVYLKREGENDGIPHDYTAVKAFNGETVIAPNCFQCHSQVFDGQLYLGMGNTFVDFSDRETMCEQNVENIGS
jgi:cytochrome c1